MSVEQLPPTNDAILRLDRERLTPCALCTRTAPRREMTAGRYGLLCPECQRAWNDWLDRNREFDPDD